MPRPFRPAVAAALTALASVATPAHAAWTTWFQPPIPWNVWLGVGSAFLLIVALVLAVNRRKDGGDGDVYRFDKPRREPMPLYEEGSTG